LPTPEASYLAWIDCSRSIPDTDAAAYLRERAHLYTSPGPDYGGDQTWTRINFATSSAVLDDILRRMTDALG